MLLRPIPDNLDISRIDTALKPFLKKALLAVSNNNLCVYSFVVCIGQNVVPVIRIQSTLYFKNKTIPICRDTKKGM